MNRTNKEFKKLEKRLYKMLDKSFGLKKYTFFADMHKGYLTLVVTGKERD